MSGSTPTYSCDTITPSVLTARVSIPSLLSPPSLCGVLPFLEVGRQLEVGSLRYSTNAGGASLALQKYLLPSETMCFARVSASSLHVESLSKSRGTVKGAPPI